MAARELFNIFLVIAPMTALLNALKGLRSDIRMVDPFRAMMKNGHMAHLVLAGLPPSADRRSPIADRRRRRRWWPIARSCCR